MSGGAGEPLRGVSLAEENERLRRALERCLLGGNHLASHIALDGPGWRAPYDEGLDFYGPGLAFDAWSCWRAIMQAREMAEAGPDG